MTAFKPAVLITGGQGQLGRELARLLAQRQIPFRAPGRQELDITDETQVEQAVAEAAPGVVFHTAAWTDVDGCQRDPERASFVNAEATAGLARVCARMGTLMVYVSTDFVFDGAQRVPYEPDDAPRPLNAYGESKLAGERAVLEAGGPAIVARTSWVYGVFGRNFPKAILRAAAERHRGTASGPLRVVEDQVGSPTHARDLAWALLELAGLGKRGPEPLGHGVVHVANKGSCSRYEFAREILRQAGGLHSVQLEPIVTSQLSASAQRPAYSVLGLARLEGMGLRMRPWQEALGRFLEELRAQEPQLFPWH